MQIFAAIFMMMAIVAAISGFPREQRESLPNRSSALAQQMIWYHNQAVIQCSSPNPSCPVGNIPVITTSLPSGSGVNYSNYFQSVTNGNTILTTWQPANVPFSQAGVSGMVVAELKTQSNGSLFAGAYNSSMQTIGIGSVFIQSGSLTSYPTISIPLNFAGLALVNGQPVIATPVN